MRQSPFSRLAGVLVLGTLLGVCAHSALLAQDRPPAPPAQPSAPAQDPYRLTRRFAGDAKPVILHADEVATWPEKDFSGDHLAILLRGTVLAQENAAQARFQQGFAWVDVRQYRESGLLHVVIYGEGEARVDDGLDVHQAPRALLDLTTRGELRVNAHKTKVVQQPRADDPVVQRARAFGLGPGRSPPAPVLRTGLQQPTPTPGVMQPTLPPQPQLPAFLTPDPPAPPRAAPAAPTPPPMPPMPRPGL